MHRYPVGPCRLLSFTQLAAPSLSVLVGRWWYSTVGWGVSLGVKQSFDLKTDSTLRAISPGVSRTRAVSDLLSEAAVSVSFGTHTDLMCRGGLLGIRAQVLSSAVR